MQAHLSGISITVTVQYNISISSDIIGCAHGSWASAYALACIYNINLYQTMHLTGMMISLLSCVTSFGASSRRSMRMCSAFQSSASALRIPCAYNRRRYLLSTTATTADDVEHQHQQPVDAPYFPIHYNDVYVVDMPPGHRYVLCRDSFCSIML